MQAKLIDKCRTYSNGRKDIHFYIIDAPSEKEAREWVEKNVHYQPTIRWIIKGDKYFIAEVESWVD